MGCEVGGSSSNPFSDGGNKGPSGILCDITLWLFDYILRVYSRNKVEVPAAHLALLIDKWNMPKLEVWKDEEEAEVGRTPVSSVPRALKPMRETELVGCPRAIFEPADPSVKPMYPKHKVYAGTSDFQLEEIFAAEYYKNQYRAIGSAKKSDEASSVARSLSNFSSAMTLHDGDKTETHAPPTHQTYLQDKFASNVEVGQSHRSSDESNNALSIYTVKTEPNAGIKFNVFSDDVEESKASVKSKHFIDGQTSEENSSKKPARSQINIFSTETVSKVDNKFSVFCDDDNQSGTVIKSNNQSSNESGNKSSIKFNIFSDETPPKTEDKSCMKSNESSSHLPKLKFNVFTDETAVKDEKEVSVCSGYESSRETSYETKKSLIKFNIFSDETVQKLEDDFSTHSGIDKPSKVISKPSDVKFGVHCDEDEKPQASINLPQKPKMNFKIFSDETESEKSSALPRIKSTKTPKFDILCDEEIPEKASKFEPLKKPSTKFGIFVDEVEPSASKIPPKVQPPASKNKKFNIFSDETISKSSSKIKVYSEEGDKKSGKEENDQIPLHIKKSIFPQSHKLKR